MTTASLLNSIPVCCGSNLGIKKILIIARNGSLLHAMYIITNRNEKNDEELSQKIFRLNKKRSLNRRLAFGYPGQREKNDILLWICDVVNGKF